MMKNTLVRALLLVSLCFVLALGLVACGDDKKDPIETTAVTTEPGSPEDTTPPADTTVPVDPGETTEPGETTKLPEPGHTHAFTGGSCTAAASCACGVTEPAPGHDYEKTASTALSCTQDASDTYTCTRCSDSYTTVTAHATGHTLGSAPVKEVEEEGKACSYILRYRCTACGEFVNGETYTRHDPVASVTKEASCVADGVKTVTCRDCDEVSTVAIPKNAAGHAWNEGALSGNIRTYTCIHTGCGATRTVVDASHTTKAEVKAEDLAAAGTVQFAGASIGLDADTLSQMSGKDLTIGAAPLNKNETNSLLKGLTQEQREQLGSAPIYDFTMADQNGAITRFDGVVTVTIPYTLAEGEDVDSIAVWYMSDEGPVSVKATYSNGFVTFETTHFSYYTVTRLTPAERCALYGHSQTTSHRDATCTEGGYDLAICIRCGKTEKTAEVPAAGHKYTEKTTAPTCTEKGEKAFACSACGQSYTQTIPATGHAWQIGETIAAPTCIATGSQERTCTGCNTTYLEELPKLPHTYSAGSEVTKEPTCTEPGEETLTCTCGATKTTPIPTVDHKYEGGKCTMCQRSEGDCDHKTFTTGYVDFAKHGACGGVLFYRTCACGEVMDMFLERGEVICDMEGDSDVDTDENGNQKLSSEGTCPDCGLYMLANATASRTDGCSYSVTGDCFIRLGDKTLFDGGVYTPPFEEHENTEQRTVPLGTCGTSISARFCTDCDKAVSSGNIRMNCNIGEGDMVMTETEVNGVTNIHAETTCPDCGIHLVGDQYAEWETPCTGTYYEKTYVYLGDTVLFAYEDSDFGERHDVEESYTLLGDTCEDGVRVETACKKCDLAYAYKTTRHQTGTKTFDLAELGGCAGSIQLRVCEACDKKLAVYGLDSECDFSYNDGSENGSSEEYSCRTCRSCGLVWEQITTRSDRVNCQYIRTSTEKLTIGDKEILQSSESWTHTQHDVEYTYTLKGESCNDGYTGVGTCRDCGETQTTSGMGHNTEYIELDLKTLGACGGIVETRTCQVCKKITSWDAYNFSCGAPEVRDQYVDAEGNTHTTWTLRCTKCGMTRVEDQWDTKVGSCQAETNERLTITLGSDTIFDQTSGYTYTTHDMTYSFRLNGKSCEDGYTATATCRSCGVTENDSGMSHRTYPVKIIDLSKHGSACGGAIHLYSCACGADGYMSTGNLSCETGWTHGAYMEDGVRYEVETMECKSCNLRIQNTYWRERDAASCTAVTQYTVIISLGNAAVDKLSYTTQSDSHDYQNIATLRPGATSCEDGVTITSTCRDCGYSYDRNVDWHWEIEMERIDLSACGSACGGYVTLVACACGEYSSLNHTDSFCDFDDYWMADPWYSETGVSGHYYTLEGYRSYYCSEQRTLTCAVTSPACGFTIRYQSYWVPTGDGCTAAQWEVWDIGGRIIKRQTSSTIRCHTYQETETQYTENGFNINSVQMKCTACGATYREDHYFHAESHVELKYTTQVKEANAWSERTMEYIQYGDSVCNSREYLRVHDENGEEYWQEYRYTYSGCTQTVTYKDSNSGDFTEVYHHFDNTWDYIEAPSCARPGLYGYICRICKQTLDEEPREEAPYGHSWYAAWNGVPFCARCGLENANGADGDIILEDVTADYGSADRYAVAYWSDSDIRFIHSVGIVLGDGTLVLLDGVKTTEDDGIVYLNKADIRRAAAAKGHAEGSYDVRLAFVPLGGDGTLDYAITLTEGEGKLPATFTETTSVIIHLDSTGRWEARFQVSKGGYCNIEVNGWWEEYEILDENGEIAFDRYLEAGKTYTIYVTGEKNSYICLTLVR